MHHIILYHTVGCHLCEDAEALLLPFVDADIIRLNLIDIADDDSLLELYGVRIPVIKNNETGAELGWPFDHTSLQGFFNLN